MILKNSKVVTQLHTDLRGRRNIPIKQKYRGGGAIPSFPDAFVGLYVAKIDKDSEKPTPLPEYVMGAPKMPKYRVRFVSLAVFFGYGG